MKIKLLTIPNAVTCLNLAAGCAAIERAFAGDWAWAFGMIVVAAVFDFLDGLCARLLHSYSEVGKQLDSLADVVSFGAAPALVLFCFLRDFHGAGWEAYLAFAVAVFSALRLAKFNLDTRQSVDFIGLPTPANALIISSSIYVLGETPGFSPWWLIGVAGGLSVLLVSEIPMFSLKFKSLGWRGNEKRYVFLGLSAVLLILCGLKAVPVIGGLYILESICLRISCRTSSKILEPSK